MFDLGQAPEMLMVHDDYKVNTAEFFAIRNAYKVSIDTKHGLNLLLLWLIAMARKYMLELYACITIKQQAGWPTFETSIEL